MDSYKSAKFDDIAYIENCFQLIVKLSLELNF